MISGDRIINAIFRFCLLFAAKSVKTKSTPTDGITQSGNGIGEPAA